MYKWNAGVISEGSTNDILKSAFSSGRGEGDIRYSLPCYGPKGICYC